MSIERDGRWSIRTVIFGVWIVTVRIGGISFVLRNWIDSVTDFDFNDEARESTVGSFLFGKLVELDGLFLHAVILTIEPAWPNIGDAIDGKGLHAGWLDWFVTRLPFTFGGINFGVNWTHIVVYNCTDDGVRAIPEAGTVMIAVPNNSGNSG